MELKYSTCRGDTWEHRKPDRFKGGTGKTKWRNIRKPYYCSIYVENHWFDMESNKFVNFSDADDYECVNGVTILERHLDVKVGNVRKFRRILKKHSYLPKGVEFSMGGAFGLWVTSWIK